MLSNTSSPHVQWRCYVCDQVAIQRELLRLTTKLLLHGHEG